MMYRFVRHIIGTAFVLAMVGISSAHAQIYTQNFNLPDGTTNLGDGSAIFGSQLGAANGQGDQSGVL